MLLSFSIANFRSFREEQTLSLVASNRHTDHPEHLTAIPDDENKALPVAALYGANGAGKSNTIKALQCLEQLVIHGTAPKKAIQRQAFRLDKTSHAQPTEFTLQFIEDNRVFNYGIRFSDTLILAEWLVLLRDGKEITVFERLTKENGDVEISPGPVLSDDSWGDHSKVIAFAKVGVLPNQLFLHAISKAVREKDQGPVIVTVLRWFFERLTIIEADAPFMELADLVARDATFTDFAGSFLRRVATGVDRLRVDTAELEEKMLVGFGPEVQRSVGELPVGEIATFLGLDGSQLIVEKEQGTKVRLRTVQSEHLTADGDRVTFAFGDESDGTQRLTHLLPSLHAIRKKPSVFVIDEIDRSLHPLLSKGFVREFLKECATKGSQLIFTTHDTSFLDLGLLRRDEIWFAEKKPEKGATELYSLADFKVRKDLKIDKGYMEGRFGAVPPLEHELPEWVGKIMAELRTTAEEPAPAAE
jgi:uncharacterized protein